MSKVRPDYTKELLDAVCDLVCNQESNFEEAELYGILDKALKSAYEVGMLAERRIQNERGK